MNKIYTFHNFHGLKGGVTIVTRLNEVQGHDIGVAWCNPKDQFSRKMGRTIAVGRMKLYGNTVGDLRYALEVLRKRDSNLRVPRVTNDLIDYICKTVPERK